MRVLTLLVVLLLATPVTAGDLPSVEHFTLRNGVDVYFVARPDIPLVRADLIFQVPPEAEPETRAGLASVTLSSVLLGIEGEATKDLMRDLDRETLLLDPQMGAATIGYSLLTSDQHLQGVMSDLGAMLDAPELPAWGIEMLVPSHRAEIRARQLDAGATALRRWYQLALGEHPLTRPRVGTTAGLGAIRRQNVEEFWDRFLHPDRATLLITGGVGVDQVRAILERSFASWGRDRETRQVRIERLHPQGDQAVVLEHMEGRRQAYIVVGGVLTNPTRKDRATLAVLDHVLGGSFGSRINRRLRIESGSTYGVSTTVEPLRDTVTFAVVASARGEVAPQALGVAIEELTAIGKSQPIEARELARAQAGVAAQVLLAHATLEDTIGLLRQEVRWGWDPTRPEEWIEAIRQVTAEDVTALAARLLEPDQIAAVVVGDAETLEAPLRALGLPIRVVGRSAPEE